MAKSYAELFAEVRERVRTISLDALKERLDAATPTTLVDVREQHEFNAGYIPGAVHIPRGFLEQQAEGKLPDRKASQEPAAKKLAAGSQRSSKRQATKAPAKKAPAKKSSPPRKSASKRPSR